MLRKFKVTIDGKDYLVEMEEIGAVSQPVVSPVTTKAPAVSEPLVTPTVPEDTPSPVRVSAGADALTAPMPGSILKILVQPNEVVQENQPLLILEAMKMENEVVANRAGTITGIHVQPGDMVNPGDALLTIG